MAQQSTLSGKVASPWEDVCSESCYNAKGERCECHCGGRYHGLGNKKSIEEKEIATK